MMMTSDFLGMMSPLQIRHARQAGRAGVLPVRHDMSIPRIFPLFPRRFGHSLALTQARAKAKLRAAAIPNGAPAKTGHIACGIFRKTEAWT
jgi:hypothetical protein